VVGVLGGRMTFKRLSDQTGGTHAIVEQQSLAGQRSPPHVHRHETEIFIYEGQFEVTIGGQKMAVSAGTMVVAPRDIPHTFRNVEPDEGQFLLTFIPGRFANYFIEADGEPYTRGTSSHVHPVFNTKRMPLRVWRSLFRFRPGPDLCSGIQGSKTVHGSSLMS
jgi:quercetin dioxygenase-like cupin family protein